MSKRILVAFLILSMIIGLVACAGNNPIDKLEFTEKEEEMIKSLGIEEAFRYNLNLAQIDCEEIEIIHKYYEDGKLKDETPLISTSGFDEMDIKDYILNISTYKKGFDEDSKISYNINLGGASTKSEFDGIVRENDISYYVSKDKVEDIASDEEVYLIGYVADSKGSVNSNEMILEDANELISNKDRIHFITIQFYN